jgi:rubrerythrin
MVKLVRKVQAVVRKSPGRKPAAKRARDGAASKPAAKRARDGAASNPAAKRARDGAASKPAAKRARNGAASKLAEPPPENARVDFAKLTLKDALDLAILIEEEAEERYEKLSQMVGGRYAGDAGDVFRDMARNEVRHRTELEEQRRRLFGRARRTISRDVLDDVEAPDWTRVDVFMSARQAMEVAAEDERKAYDFYDRAAAHVKDRAVRKLFQELRGEESKHEATLRKRMKGLPEGPDVDVEVADEPGSDAG